MRNYWLCGVAFAAAVAISGAANAQVKLGVAGPITGPNAAFGAQLVNGTQQMTAMGALYIKEAEELAELADLICTTTLEGIAGSPRAFADWLLVSVG